ncbi:MAG: PKD domain-containing protein [Blastocatellales bacterium]
MPKTIGRFLTSIIIDKRALTAKTRISLLILLLVGLGTGYATMSGRQPEYRSGVEAEAINLARLPVIGTPGPLMVQEPQQTCTLDCTATVPGTGAVMQLIQFQSTATAVSCASQPTFDWNFGDGTPHSSQQNPTHSYSTAGTYEWTLTTSVNTGALQIDTVAGGYGEGNPIRQAPFGELSAVAMDPQGRGLYVADNVSGQSIIRFLNLSNAAVTLAGVTIQPGTVRLIAGGGFEIGENTPARTSDLGQVTGLGVSGDGNVLYFANKIDARVSGLNLSSSSTIIAGQAIAPASIGTLAGNFDTDLNGLAVNTSTGVIYVADATAGVNKVFSIDPDGTKTVVAGNGAITNASEPFSPGLATAIPLLLPRSVQVEANGSLVIADTGHARVIRVDGAGNATLVQQYAVSQANPNPYPSGLAVQNGNVYVANGNQQTVARVSGGVTVVAGIVREFCDYTISNCGDGGPATSAGLNIAGSTASPPLAGIAADANGIFILDQGQVGRSRIRYVNLSGGAVAISGVDIPAGAIDTIAGSGLASPFDGGPATGAAFNTPTGVAVDPNGNLWVSDTLSAKLRFVNRGSSPVTIFAGTPAEQVVPAGGIVTVNKDVGAGAADGVPVNFAAFDSPQGVWATAQGVYVADSKNGPAVPPQTINNKRSSLIRFINTTASNVTIYPGSGQPIVVQPGYIAKIAGGSTNEGPNGDGGFALNARFIGASDVVVTSNATIYIADAGQKAVRKIDGTSGTVSSLALAQSTYTGLGLDSTGRLYIANYDGNSILRENSAGSGAFSVMASGITKARDVAVGADGTAYATAGPAAQQNGNHQIVQVTSGGTVSVIAGSTVGFSGDGGAASAAQINISPSNLNAGSGAPFLVPETVNITVASNGNILFTDSNNNRVRQLSQSVTTCVKTGTITISGSNPSPTLTSLDPASALQGSGAFTLTINGTNFVPSSMVRWNGADRTTTYVSSTQVTAAIPATDLSNAGTAQVTVFNPAPGGGTSNSLTFTITAPNPVPALTSLSPNTAVENSPAFNLTVNGTGFVNGAVVRWDGQSRTTSFVSSTQLTAQILATDLQGVGQAAVTVFNPAPGGGTSNSLNFSITATPSPVPTLTGLSSNSAVAGSPGFTLTVTGTGFVGSSKVRWNGADRLTTVVSATQMTAEILDTDLAAAGTAQVTVFNPAPGGGTSSGLTFTIVAPNPAPTATSLSPNSAVAGGANFTLTVNGTNFIAGSKVRWNGADRTTTFVSATQLTADIPAADIVNAGTAQVTVFNPAPGGGTSSGLTFTIVAPNPAPTATSLSPNSAVAGGANFTLTVNGTNFIAGSKVRWNGADRTTMFVSATQLTAEIPAADIANAGTAQVTVFNPAPGGGTSSALTFTIVAPNPAPTATSLSPNSAVAGGANFTLTVNGTNFIAGSKVRWNGADRTTTFVSATQLTADIPAADIANAGTAQVTVFNPAPGGGTSSALTFTIVAPNPLPVLTSMTPSTAFAGQPGFTLTVDGSGFVSGSKVRWNGADRTTTFISATQLTADIPASDIAGAGYAQVTVFSPAPGGGTTQALTFTISPMVTVSAASFLASGIAPESIVAGFGLNMTTGVEVATTIPLPTTLLGTRVVVKDSTGTERDAPLFFVAPTQINYQIPPGTATGPADVTVITNGTTTSVGTITVNQVGPGLISANSNGTGVAAAVVLRVSTTGAQTFEPIAGFNQMAGAFEPIEVDMGPEGEQIYLILYGTGFRGNSGLGNVSVTVDGAAVPVLYAGLAPDFIGLDQVNLGPLPRTLIGRKSVDIVMTVDGAIANTVQISIK